jgi:hypothetical protein
MAVVTATAILATPIGPAGATTSWTAALWWRAQSGHAPILWSMRAGCLLACDAAGAMGRNNSSSGKPQPTGAQALQQFLRLRVARDLLVDATPRPRRRTFATRLRAANRSRSPGT